MAPPPGDDPFDEVLALEERFYDEGHRQGAADGARAGRAEGRALGLEKGFEKFLESGRLHGRALVWANRLPPGAAAGAGGPGDRRGAPASSLPPLPAGARLERNVATLHALVEPETLSTENSDEAVNDFDDRVKRAQGKARVIERSLGEEAGPAGAGGRSPGGDRDGAGEGKRSPGSPPPAPPAAF